jgi:hypothetical protein
MFVDKEFGMSCPRVFVSSTYYDLKHVRASLENFIEQLGYEPILSEKGDIAYVPDKPLDESCYREVLNADVFVLIIGGRYGTEKSDGKKKIPKSFYDRYESITKQEYINAFKKDIPVYILIEKAVYADYETYLQNKNNENIVYAHVDSANIFRLIEEILLQPKNNPVHHFDRYFEIEKWLKSQWAGLFKELLVRKNTQQQLTSLSVQVSELSEVNKTLKVYLETVMLAVDSDKSKDIIKEESKRLNDASQLNIVKNNSGLCHYLLSCGNTPEVVLKALLLASDLENLYEILKPTSLGPKDAKKILTSFRKEAQHDFNRLKIALEHPDEENGGELI